ncbi:cation efflux protein [Apodospora peruviana]|uniref:Cation efflux protein n=1 Tax=Apodospora peruviana TaxID=516989 RepID=A0AAE0MEZ4_9PEZI|nr:cation efflux protein [Apodospora peruviana]
MAWSKSARIRVMLGICIVFFLVELIVGMVVGSLALLADAFHMLNDIISLLVGLWAVSAATKATTDRFSYGLLRAEILGAFFNAVFLIALCVSIVLEALTRFIDPPEINNPKLILIVGCFGLASNLVGFVVLGGHGHSHGPGEHSHGEEGHSHSHGEEHSHSHDELNDAEEGRASFTTHQQIVADEDGRVADLLPEAAVSRIVHSTAGQTPGQRQITSQGESSRSQRPRRGGSMSSNHRRTRTPVSVRHTRLTSIEDMSIHPASFRQEIIDASRAQPEDEESSSDSNTDDDTAVQDDAESRETSPLLRTDSHGKGKDVDKGYGTRSAAKKHSRRSSEVHHGHNHTKPKKANGKGGHNHDDMGMNAMILHVLGDALGNVGVIITALVIWLTDWPGRFYADPAVSLFITLIILRSAIPLTIAASKILLQATPDSIDISHIRDDISKLPHIQSCHHVHVWQLSDAQVVASLHIQVDFPIAQDGGRQYMEIDQEVRRCLHAYGIHSATIQPEFCLDEGHAHGQDPTEFGGDGATLAASPPRCVTSEKDGCLLDCVDGCVAQGCCKGATGSRPESSHSDSGGHDEHGHSH